MMQTVFKDNIMSCYILKLFYQISFIILFDIYTIDIIVIHDPIQLPTNNNKKFSSDRQIYNIFLNFGK